MFVCGSLVEHRTGSYSWLTKVNANVESGMKGWRETETVGAIQKFILELVAVINRTYRKKRKFYTILYKCELKFPIILASQSPQSQPAP